MHPIFPCCPGSYSSMYIGISWQEKRKRTCYWIFSEFLLVWIRFDSRWRHKKTSCMLKVSFSVTTKQERSSSPYIRSKFLVGNILFCSYEIWNKKITWKVKLCFLFDLWRNFCIPILSLEIYYCMCTLKSSEYHLLFRTCCNWIR